MNRPVTAGHTAAAIIVLLAGLDAHFVSFPLLGNVLVAGTGLVLMRPTNAQPQPDALPQVSALVNDIRRDPLVPFAMHSRRATTSTTKIPRASPTAGEAKVRRDQWRADLR